MLKWSAIFFVIAIIAGLLGFTGVAGSSMAIAKVLFFLFLIPGILLLVLGIAVFRRL